MTAASLPTEGKGALELNGLTKTYGEERVVDTVSATIRPGEFFSLLGPSGSGKTTTLMMIAGFVLPDGGTIQVDGADFTRVPPQRRGLGMVFQNYAIFPHLNVFENVAFPLRARRIAEPELRQRVQTALELVQLTKMYGDVTAVDVRGVGDDLILDTPQIGERDPRSEDRQLLLDALLAATERLVITYSGNDERTNTPRPAAVPVGELLDTIDATVRREDGDARAQVLIRHPLQPFDPRNFEAQGLMTDRTWSFDPVTLEGARALIAPRATERPFLEDRLPPRAGRVIELADLVRFVEHPVRAFLRQRLGISLRGGVDEIEDGLPVELDPLQRWAVGQRLLQALRAGVDGNTAIKATHYAVNGPYGAISVVEQFTLTRPRRG